MMIKALWLAPLLLCSKANALDLAVDSISCESLPVMVTDFSLTCEGTSQCTLGSTAEVSGVLKYDGVQNAGTDGENLYLSGQLGLWSIDYDLMNFYAFPLCWADEYDSQQAYDNQENYGQQAYDNQGNDGQQAYDNQGNDGQQAYDNQGNDGQGNEGQGDNDGANDNGGRRFLSRTGSKQRRLADQCPADGEYPFSVSYRLPNQGSPQVTWLATGFTSKGTFQVYARAEENDGANYLVGECSVDFKTYVTSSAQDGFMRVPSAATTAGIVLAALAAFFLICCYCYCCMKRRRTRKEQLAPGDDPTSSFRRMDEAEENRERVNVDGKVV